MWTAAEELGAVYGGYRFVAGGFEGVELGTVGGQVGAEGLDALGRFVCLGGVELVLGEIGILVYGAREGGKGGGDLALEGWRGSGRRGSEGIEIFPDGGGLFEGGVEDGVLRGIIDL